ncbi:hypothetical protein RvY_12072 [Ramazzottius varieornatus]|uniref:Uncharacterized protein n=1 Tax=Ramazzottius varieornatus TaxID=947166 RepID=A0A1D1VI85_RAMVA|nr:hypothetical protein RvY_12072 [Ramazzottius varieornatus]
MTCFRIFFGVLALVFSLVAVIEQFAESSSNDLPEVHLSRKRRQAFSQINSQLFNPFFFQSVNNLPQPSAQFTDRCFALTGQFPPFGCSYVPNLFSPINNVVLNCRLDCSNIPIDQSVQPLPVLSFFQEPSADYLTSGNYRITDQSNLDVFVGDSNYLFTPSSAAAITTTRAPTTTTTRTTTTTTAARPVTTPTTIATTTPPTTTTTLSPAAFIALCIEKQCAPSSGTSYVGTGTITPFSCATLSACSVSPFVNCATLPIPATNVEQCLQLTGAPPPGCTYTGTGLLHPTLTCPTICAVPGCVKTSP